MLVTNLCRGCILSLCGGLLAFIYKLYLCYGLVYKPNMQESNVYKGFRLFRCPQTIPCNFYFAELNLICLLFLEGIIILSNPSPPLECVFLCGAEGWVVRTYLLGIYAPLYTHRM